MDEVFIAVLRMEHKQMNPGAPRMEILAVSTSRETAIGAIIERWSMIQGGDMGLSRSDVVELVSAMSRPQPWVLSAVGDFYSFSLFEENVQP